MGDPDTDLEDQELAGIDMAHLEQAYRKQQLYTIPPDQLRKVHKVFLNSSAGGSARASTNLEYKKKPQRNNTSLQKRRKREAGNRNTNSFKTSVTFLSTQVKFI
jgi:hypothetical protein